MHLWQQVPLCVHVGTGRSCLYVQIPREIQEVGIMQTTHRHVGRIPFMALLVLDGVMASELETLRSQGIYVYLPLILKSTPYHF